VYTRLYHSLSVISDVRRRALQPLPGVCRFPAGFKEASITPAMKKSGLDPSYASSYRPISYLSVLSKLLERIVVRQLMTYLTDADLLPPLYRPASGQVTPPSLPSCASCPTSTRTDILLPVDRGDFAALVLLERHFTRSTTTSSYSVSNRASGSPTSQGTGSGRICRAEGNLSVAEAYGRLLFP